MRTIPTDWRDVVLTGIAAILMTAPNAIVAIGLLLALTPAPSHGRELYPGQYAQYPPEIREWFRSQKSPRTGISCCSEADGTYAEEEIRDGHYWTRFTWQFCFAKQCQDLDSGWMDVPDDVVIHDPNRHGAPVVWWTRASGTEAATAKVRIRCYVPGSGV
jgi:hypothetical protein